MGAFNKREFWEELEATSEEFVRQKHAIDGYNSAKSKIVEQWLALRDRGRREKETQAKARMAKITIFVALLGTAITVLISVFFK